MKPYTKPQNYPARDLETNYNIELLLEHAVEQRHPPGLAQHAKTAIDANGLVTEGKLWSFTVESDD
ncbi:MAG: hypothetical protein HOI43_04645 [Gammaproteobacteria bacterium]|nr:hypothetical protein [Gammaproteobacteria bacterium]MBT6244683.1 hypothetical protein [Gammaproteobacteria bacterium]